MLLFIRRLLTGLLFLPLAAHGTLVTTATDEDNGSLGGGTGTSLREAVNYSPPSETITFAPALSGQTIRLTLGEILIANSITVDASSLPARVTLSGDKTGNGKSADDTRIINIAGGTVVLDSLILDSGYCPSGTAKHGAAIHVYNSLTRLMVRNSTISNNETTTYGGGIYFMGNPNNPNSSLTIQKCDLTGNSTGHDGGAIHMTGTLRVEDSVFSKNVAYQGSAIFNDAGVTTVENSTFTGSAAYGYGGAIYNEGAFTLRDSMLAGNSAPRGGAICNSSGTLTVESSSIVGNLASSSGGGIFASGVLNLLNSTLSGNSATVSGGGIYCNLVTTSLNHTTVSGNSAGSSFGGIYSNTRSTLALGNSIVAGNTSPSTPDLSGDFAGANNLTSGSPRLAPLGDHGGSTQTMPPLPGSPAINAGGTTTLITDQRGFSRVGIPDIGAAEYQEASDIIRFWKRDFDGDGSPFGVEQALGTDPLVSDSTSSRNLWVPFRHAGGGVTLGFGLGPAAFPGTAWVLKRSTDLTPGSFVEIYRYDGSADTVASGVTHQRTATEITITDGSPPPGGAFYRFEAVLP